MFDSLCAVQRGPARAGSVFKFFCLHPIAHFTCHSLVTKTPIGQLVESSSAKHVH